ncbi:type VII secretion protein EccB [Mycobacterium bohemicum]|uniref:Type VII secretion protein EccB n=1 Tax=Mycobacterium bohemicum TaxID=56425 RepID=A0A1X1R8E1_MYCBE|nr:type VII secretion protein EccB [Mycobacterium bohemicum]MCV6969687.1 type VII secretion protein EccB [Mycobacterium bohemicum]ORV01223.1 type VII secretion protein EccB [Mycobacterium bohemicum]
MPRQPTTWVQVSGYRFLLRRLEAALLTGSPSGPSHPAGGRGAPLVLGCVLAAVATAGCALLAFLRPQPALERAQIVVTRESGALFVRVGDTWHPVLNLASARLVAATPASPLPVRESDLANAKRGPLLGIPGAPSLLGRPLTGEESTWTVCDADGGGGTTVVVGPAEGAPADRLAADRAVLVTPPSGAPAYLLYDGRRAMVDLGDAAVLRALRLEGRAPRPVSQWLLDAIPEASPIAAPRVHDAGRPVAGLPGIPAGSVLRIARADGDEYYAVVAGGVQRIGGVAADLIRFSNSRGATDAVTVAADTLRGAAIVDALPVGSFPDRAPGLVDGGGDLCVARRPAPAGRSAVELVVRGGPPIPPGQAPVTLSQADGGGPALDAVYLPPGRSAYVRDEGPAATRYLVTETGVRFPVHGDDAAHDLGLPAAAVWAPRPVLAALPTGPELSRETASLARDAVAAGP